MRNRRAWLVGLSLLLPVAASVSGCKGGEGGGELQSNLGYDEGSSELLVILNRDLGDGEVLHARIRSLAEGESLNCETDVAKIPEIRGKHEGEHVYTGPQVEPSIFDEPTGPSTLLGETPEQYAERLARTYFVDICVTKDGSVTHQARYDIRQALDRAGKNGKFDVDDDGVRIVSNKAYAEACIAEMGDIPFWGERLDGTANDWAPISCLEVGTPIPSTVTDAEGNVSPVTEQRSQLCDNPQYIYDHCEPFAGAEPGLNGPRVAHARNDQGTHWVLLCRKSHEAEGRYEDMAMIGHNPFSGRTCFFQNQLPFGEEPKPSNDGTAIPHPADDVNSERSPVVWNDLWMGIQGGIGPEGGIQCAGCHSTDPFIHTPWIDGALNEAGNPVVPKMGHDPDFVEGYNGPYTLLDAADQGWTMPQHLVSEEAAACTKCHRIGRDQWISASALSSEREDSPGGCVFCDDAPWMRRLVGEDSAWEALRTESHHDFADVYWMPPNAGEVMDDELWPESEFAAAFEFIRKCGENPDDPACVWAPLPTTPSDPSELPVVEESGRELAVEALTVLGAPVTVDGESMASRRCSECHPVSRRGLEHWVELTREAHARGVDIHTEIENFGPERAKMIVDALRHDGPGTVFSAEKLGIFAAGVQFSFFQRLMQTAYDAAAWPLEYGAFRQRVSMPKGSHPPISAREFAVLEKWFVDEEAAHLGDLLEEEAPPATCEEAAARNGVTQIDPWLSEHIASMQFDGWAARNEEAGIDMFGCSGDDYLKTCFTDAPAHANWADAAIPGVRIVQVRDLGFDTSFWTRTSADGRFVGNGGRGSGSTGYGSTITDLLAGKDIGVKGSYDPGFFPNNKGFIMQGAGAGLCSQSVLTDETAFSDGGIDFTEPGCSKAAGINLYQHVAVSLEGGDYFVINSQFTSDSGSNNEDPRANFSDTSTMKFSPLVHDGQTWVQKPAVVVDSPYEGDSVLSPSGKLVISRVAKGDGTAHGYMIRRVDATPNAESYDIKVDKALEFLCMPGAKANISFDERFVVTHHYENGTSNLYLADLVDGAQYKITNMPMGVKALFPHFVSSGWIYFLVTGEGGDKVIATDAALQVAATKPL